jgi:periplasmic protein TonB
VPVPPPTPEPPPAPKVEAPPPVPRTPPPARVLPPADSARHAPPAIRLGDGSGGPAADILDSTGRLRSAKADTGNIPPEYPLEAARRLEQGTVVLRLFIAASGDVSDVIVLHSSGSRSLDQTAADRLRTWHFTPALKDGKPVPDVMDQAVNFTLD